MKKGSDVQDNVKCENKEGLHAYLFMFGTNKNGFRQLRLAIYGN